MGRVLLDAVLVILFVQGLVVTVWEISMLVGWVV